MRRLNILRVHDTILLLRRPSFGGGYIYLNVSLCNLILNVNLDEALCGMRRAYVHAKDVELEQAMRPGLSFSFKSCYDKL